MRGNSLEGIGGWLLLFVIGQLVYPVYTVYAVEAEQAAWLASAPQIQSDPAFIAFMGGLRTISRLGAAIMVICGLLLVFVRSWISVRLNIASLWLVPLGQILALYVLSNRYGLVDGDWIFNFSVLAVVVVITASLWTAYLLRSQRVANTYPH